MKYEKESLSRLLEWMQQKGWTKREFASRMGIHEANVNKYLNGSLNLENNDSRRGLCYCHKCR